MELPLAYVHHNLITFKRDPLGGGYPSHERMPLYPKSQRREKRSNSTHARSHVSWSHQQRAFFVLRRSSNQSIKPCTSTNFIDPLFYCLPSPSPPAPLPSTSCHCPRANETDETKKTPPPLIRRTKRTMRLLPRRSPQNHPPKIPWLKEMISKPLAEPIPPPSFLKRPIKWLTPVIPRYARGVRMDCPLLWKIQMPLLQISFRSISTIINSVLSHVN